MIKEKPIAALLADNKLQGVLMVSDDILLKSWRELFKICRLGDSSKLLWWCAYDSNLLPFKNDSRFKKLTSTRGISEL